MPIVLLVFGGRNYGRPVTNDQADVACAKEERSKLEAAIVGAHFTWGILELVHGGASGADQLAGSIARAMGIPVRVFKANWDTYGKAAGHRRNEKQGRYVAGFLPYARALGMPGGNGTANMAEWCKKLGIPLL